jgi:catalase
LNVKLFNSKLINSPKPDRSAQGIRTLSPQRAAELDGLDPDYGIRDLYNAIESNQFPTWDFGIQVMTFDQAATYRWNPFDITKLWPFQDFPFIPVGKLVLNRNPTDYFTQIEMAGFSPSSFVTGIEPSPDRMLHARMFAYSDTQRHRLGPNFLQLPVNRPAPGVGVFTYQKDGFMCSDDNGAGAPNYFPNSFGGPFVDRSRSSNGNGNESVVGIGVSSRLEVERRDVGEEDNYSQADFYWKTVLDPAARERVVMNLADSLIGTTEVIKRRVVSKMFQPINSEIGTMLRSAIMNHKTKTRR